MQSLHIVIQNLGVSCLQLQRCWCGCNSRSVPLRESVSTQLLLQYVSVTDQRWPIHCLCACHWSHWQKRHVLTEVCTLIRDSNFSLQLLLLAIGLSITRCQTTASDTHILKLCLKCSSYPSVRRSGHPNACNFNCIDTIWIVWFWIMLTQAPWEIAVANCSVCNSKAFWENSQNLAGQDPCQWQNHAPVLD